MIEDDLLERGFIGQRVRLSSLARETTRLLKRPGAITGVVTGLSRVDDRFILVRRDGEAEAELYHRNRWEPES